MKVIAKNPTKLPKFSLRTVAAALILLAGFLTPFCAFAQRSDCPPNDVQNYFNTINEFMESQGRDALVWNDTLARAAERVATDDRDKEGLRKISLKEFLLENEYDLSRADINATVGGGDIRESFYDNLPAYKKFLFAYPFKEVGIACVPGNNKNGPYRAMIVAIQKLDLPDSERKRCSPGFARAVLSYTNDYRRVLHLPELAWSDQLAAAAEVHGEYMAEIDNAQHEGPNGNLAFERAKAQGYDYRVLAENVASGQETPLDVVMEWRNSPGHDKNLRNADITEMGAACVDRAGTRHQIFWAQELGRPR
jgi:uncharacterized protein YkwD